MKKISFFVILYVFSLIALAHEIQDLSVVSSTVHTEIYIDLPHSVKFKVLTLHNPDRIVIDIQDTSLQQLNKISLTDTGIKDIRHSYQNGKLRLVLDIEPYLSLAHTSLKERQGQGQRLTVVLNKQAGIEQTAVLSHNNHQTQINDQNKTTDHRTLVKEVKTKAPLVFDVSKSKIRVGGYARLDTMLTSFNKGTISPPSPPSVGLDLYLPSSVPAFEPAHFKSNPDFHMHAKQSRIWIMSETPLDDSKMTTYAEMDFFASIQGTEIVSNSYSLRLRQYYAIINNWLVGQAWTTFVDLKTTPEQVDFGGPAGQVSIRQPQIRWSNTFGHFQLLGAIENPTTSFIGNDENFISVTNNKKYPDFIAKGIYSSDPLYLGAALLVRNLNIHFQNVWLDKSDKWTVAGSVFGKVTPFSQSKDNFIFLLNYGNSLGRYIGLGFFPDAYISNANDILTPFVMAGFAGIQHYWCPNLRSTYVFGYMSTHFHDNDVNPQVSQKALSSQVNLMWNPYPPILMGLEYTFANRTLESGVSGNMNRVQLGLQYNYG